MINQVTVDADTAKYLRPVTRAQYRLAFRAARISEIEGVDVYSNDNRANYAAERVIYARKYGAKIGRIDARLAHSVVAAQTAHRGPKTGFDATLALFNLTPDSATYYLDQVGY